MVLLVMRLVLVLLRGDRMCFVVGCGISSIGVGVVGVVVVGVVAVVDVDVCCNVDGVVVVIVFVVQFIVHDECW